MIKILFNEKIIFLTESHHELISKFNIKNAHILFSIDKEKLLAGIDILMISEIENMLIVGDVQESLKLFKNTFKYIRAGGGVVKNSRNEYLFIFRKGKWDLPKGKLDEGEDIRFCAIREVKEETGIQQVEIIEELCQSYHIYIEKEFVFKKTEWFLMGSEDGNLKPQKEEGITKVIWVYEKNIKRQLSNTYDAIRDIFDILHDKA